MTLIRLTRSATLMCAVFFLLTTCRGKAEEPVTFNGWAKFDIPTLDPQLALDVTSIDAIENLFVQLTNYDLETADIVPEAATEWTISDDGLSYTFTLRSDIPWVQHDPSSGETRYALDSDGNPRFLSAHDFVFGIKRACDPATGAYYSSVIAPLIKGCSDVLFADHPDGIPPLLWDAIGVSALDDHTLLIQLEFPASYFLSMTPMWTLAATPHWAIDAHGDHWISPANIITNGRFVLHEWQPDTRRTFLRNPLFPADLRGSGNIERFVITVLPDVASGYARWLDAQVDLSSIPEEHLDSHPQRFPDETVEVSDASVAYISFRVTKPPFDDPRVRRAFSAAFDRDTYVDSVLHGRGLPMIHFAPPGIFGAPPIDQIGVGFDPLFARQQLAQAGFPNCRDFPRVTLVGYSSYDTLINFAKDQWIQHLGCSPDAIHIEQRPFRELLSATEDVSDDSQSPHMWTMGWAPDYADENNWVGDVLWCKSANRHRRSCNEIDDLIVHARQDPLPSRRIQLYHQIEEMFFGPQGEMPILPISLRTAIVARHSWLTFSPAPFGGDQWYAWSIDQTAQLAARP